MSEYRHIVEHKSLVASMRAQVMATAAASEKRRLRVVKDARCSPGCSGCCSRLVTVSLAEAVVMHDELVRSGRWPAVREAAEAQADLLRAAGHITWFKMNQKCPVLDPKTNLCSGYAARPAVCSTHFAKSDPSLCHPWKAGEGKFMPVDFVDLHSEMLDRMKDSHPDLEFLLSSAPMPLALLMAERLAVRSGSGFASAITAARRAR